MPNITESKNGLHVSDDLRRTPETAPSNPGGSIEPRSRTTDLGTKKVKVFIARLVTHTIEIAVTK